MKILALLFLVGCVSAFAPRQLYNEGIDSAVKEDAPAERLYRSEDGDTQSELEKKLRKNFDEILEKIKDAIEHGKVVKQDMLDKMNEIKEKMRDMKLDIGAKAKEAIKNIKEKAKDYLQKLLDKLGLKDKEARDIAEFEEFVRRDEGGDDSKDELEKKLREAFEKLLEKVKDAVERGKVVKQEVLDKMKEMRQKMKDMKIDLGEKAKDLYEKIREKAKDFLKNLLDKLGLKDDKEARDVAEFGEFVRRDEGDDDMKSKLEKKLRERFDELLEKIKDAVERGKTVNEEVLNKMKEMKEKMKEMKIDVSERAKELLKKINEKAKDFLKNLLEKLGFKDDKEARAVEELIQRTEGNNWEQKLRNAVDEIIKKIEGAFKKGETVKEEWIQDLRSLMDKMKEKKMEIHEKAKAFLKGLKEKAREFLKNLLEKLGEKEDNSSVAHADFNIKSMFKKLKEMVLAKVDKEELKEKIEKLFGKGSEMADELLRILKEKGEKGKKKLLELVDRILDEKEEKETRDARSLKEIYEKVRNYFENLGIELKEKYVKFGNWVKDTVKTGIDTSKSEIENIKAIAKEFIGKANKMSKDVATEGLEFLRPYKEDLGTLWEKAKQSVKELMGKQD